tara:strand:- start:40 stop:474 length:435 start_codon:yes stop_codon:yes gene_type:complete
MIKQCCTFYVNGLFFGVDVLKVQEVIKSQAMTSIPLSPEEINGLINLRGEIVTAIDMRTLLKSHKKGDSSEDPMNVVIITDGNPISLQVDAVGDVIDINPHRMEPPPETLDDNAKKLVESVYKLDDKLMLILNVDSAIDIKAKI